MDEKPIKMKKIGKFLNLKQKLYRKDITRIFGNFDKNKNVISFLGLNAFLVKLFSLEKRIKILIAFYFSISGKNFI